MWKASRQPPIRGVRSVLPGASPLGEHFFTYQNTAYTVLDGDTAYQAGESYVFPGLGFDQEHILLSPKNDPILSIRIQSFFSEIFLDWMQQPERTMNDFLDIASNTVGISFPRVEDNIISDVVKKLFEKEGAVLFVTNKVVFPLSSRPVAMLSDWMFVHKMGCCRHINLLGLALLGEAMSRRLIPSGELYVIDSEYGSDTAHMTL